jgi:hypothetical protein
LSSGVGATGWDFGMPFAGSIVCLDSLMDPPW